MSDSESRTPSRHEVHPDCPDSLGCLPDTSGRPQHTLPIILRCAILGSARKRLTIREIYAAMEHKYPYYKEAGPSWKQSVRHHLSLNRLFERQPRPVTEPGFGSYWTVNLTAPPGTKRPRKRGRASKDLAQGASSSVKKKRGRPRKATSPADFRERSPALSVDDHDDEEDERQSFVGDVTAEDSEDELESEEELLHPHYRRRSISGQGLTPYSSSVPQQVSLPPFSSIDPSNELLEKLQSEVVTLRRQSAEAVSVSLRLSEQVSQAQAEARRLREALAEIEEQLEEEISKRRKAERRADDEASRRHSTEEALRALMAATSLSRS